ncbi:MAG: type IV pilus assembly protein PilM [Candidatus Falkowbacteria bacterium]|jgi:type IV pilus assembly protein PilM
MGLFSPASSYLGIDIGVSSIKIVELKQDKNQPKLLSYGFTEGSQAGLAFDWPSNAKRAAQMINKVRHEAGMNARQAIAALPGYAVFSSVISIAKVAKSEIDSAVRWEAKKVIPVPLEDMVLDWRKIELPNEANNGTISVLLTGAPRSMVKKYIDIFKEAEINLLSLETDTFSLVRSLVGHDTSTVMLAELGTNTTEISVIDQGIPLLMRSIDMGGISITKAISENLGVGLDRAEQFKFDLNLGGLDQNSQDAVPKTIIEVINPLINELKYVINIFNNKHGRPVEKLVLSGGGALLVNLPSYLSKILNLNVIIGSPWSRISYPADLKPVLDEIAPRMSVAVGLALRQVE